MRARMQARPTRCALLSCPALLRSTHGPRRARPAARRARARASRARRAVRRRRRGQLACARLGPRRRWRRRRGCCRRRVGVVLDHERRRDDHAKAAGWREWQQARRVRAKEGGRAGHGERGRACRSDCCRCGATPSVGLHSGLDADIERRRGCRLVFCVDGRRLQRGSRRLERARAMHSVYLSVSQSVSAGVSENKSGHSK